MTTAWDDLDAVATAELVRSGQASAPECVEAALQRMRSRNPRLNAVVQAFEEHAREQAGTALPQGLLCGVPFLLKDTIEYPGFRYSEGSRWFSGRIGRSAPPWVQAMAREGAVFIGKTNTPEFGLMDITEPVALGPTLNPWDRNVTAGGSSGGSAAAVAAGITPIAHGSDGGGSIRFPAACCGVFGFKPTRGLTTAPYPAFDPRIHGGTVRHVLTRTVRDSALCLAIASADHAGDPGSACSRWVRGPLRKRLDIAVIDTPLHGEPLPPAVAAALAQTVQLLQELGHRVRPAAWPFDAAGQHRAFFDRWAYAVHHLVQTMEPPTRLRFLDAVEPFTRGLALRGARLSPERVEQIVHAAQALPAIMEDFHQQHTVLLTPVSAVFPLQRGHHDPMQDFDTVFERVARNVAFTFVQNIAGQPAMSVPLLWTDSGLPLGLHFAAAAGQDALLLSLAYELEQARPWAQRRPPCWAAAGAAA